MSAPRPRIAITAGSKPGATDHAWLNFDYLYAVSKAQGLPTIVASGLTGPSDDPEQFASEILDHCDGLLLSGGADVDPAIFGETPHPGLGRVDRPRDPFEISLAREAVRRDIPVLAICRGIQLLNVALGGTLIQDIPAEVPGAVAHETGDDRLVIGHDVVIEPGSRLAHLLSTTRMGVNSFHHQAPKRLGRGLVLSATSPEDGVVEGIEAPDRRFVVGVQWHPENFWKTSDVFDGLFRGLVEAARSSERRVRAVAS